MNYPFDKYRFVHTMTKKSEHKVAALSTYAGKTVRGVAICSAEDSFSLDKGKELAAARCALKIARKRVKRAEQKYLEARKATHQANTYLAKIEAYLRDANKKLVAARSQEAGILEDM